MTKLTNALGRRGERTAQKFLTGRGLALIESNWRVGRHGEIDLIMEDQGEIVFVEVKTRTGPSATVFDVISPQKLGRLRYLATAWLSESSGYRPYRIDLVGIAVQAGTATANLHWWKGIDR